MAIKTTKQELQKIVREEYQKYLREEEDTMSRESLEGMRDAAFQIAKKLAREVETTSMAHGFDNNKLLGQIIDQVKLQMKE